LAAVFVREPEWHALPPEVPVAIRRLLQRCLERDPHQRIADVAAVRFVLEEAGSLSTTASAPDPTAASRPRRATWPRVATLGGITLVVGAALAAIFMRLFTQPAPAAVTRTMIVTSPPVAMTLAGESLPFAVSADGGRVVYVGNDGTQLFVRALDRLEPVAIATGRSVSNPFVSPDGQWVGFFENGSTLKRVSMAGGPPITIQRIAGTGARGATWVTDDAIVVATSNASGLVLVPVGGGGPVSLSQPDRTRGEAEHIWPERLPGGHLVLFTITAQTGGLDAAQVAVFDLRTRTYKALLRGGSHALYVASGHLLYAASGALRAVPFDLNRLDVRGTSVQVVPRVLTTSAGGSDAAVGGDTLIYVDAPGSTSSDIRRTLAWVDRKGKEEPIGAPALPYVFPRLSPDGTRLALDIAGQERGLWIWDFRQGNLTRLTNDSALNRDPEWTQDSKRIVYTSNRSGVDNLWWRAADGSGGPEQLLTSPNTQLASAVTRDGSDLIFAERAPAGHSQLMQLALDGSRRVSPVLPMASDERNGVVSPGGRWIAYESDSSGQTEIYVRPFPDTSSGQWQVSSGGGTRPLWSREGQELYYIAPPPLAPLMRVPVETSGATFQASRAVVLLEGYAVTNPSRTYDVAADGRFVMIKPPAPGQTAQPGLIIVQHWAEELKRLVPTK
jgi:serine/threonine-protein kinase